MLGRIFRHSMLLLATLVLFAHTFIPHEHVESKRVAFSQASCCQLSVLGLLEIVLTQNHGVGHLEFFEQSTPSTSASFAAISLGSAVRVSLTEASDLPSPAAQAFSFPCSDDLPRPCFRAVLAPRAPPIG